MRQQLTTHRNYKACFMVPKELSKSDKYKQQNELANDDKQTGDSEIEREFKIESESLRKDCSTQSPATTRMESPRGPLGTPLGRHGPGVGHGGGAAQGCPMVGGRTPSPIPMPPHPTMSTTRSTHAPPTTRADGTHPAPPMPTQRRPPPSPNDRPTAN